MSSNSIKYLLVRFMGDLCSHVNILYDSKIEKHFESSNCPYSVSKKDIARISIVKRTEKDITSKDIAFDISSLYNYDFEYATKLNLKTTVHTKKAVLVRKTLEADFKK